MVLDRNPDNFFAETEQVAFCPSNIVPGIDFSNDPLLQGRLFSYLDTQLSRLGSPNFHQIPINAPKCPFAQPPARRPHADAASQGPRRLRAELARSADAARARTRRAASAASPRREEGDQGRVRAESFADHYSQARLFFRSQTEPEQAHIASALVFELSKVDARARPRGRWSGNLRNVDERSRSASPTGSPSTRCPPRRRRSAGARDRRARRRCRSSAR